MQLRQTKTQVYSNGGDLSKKRFLQRETNFDVELFNPERAW